MILLAEGTEPRIRLRYTPASGSRISSDGPLLLGVHQLVVPLPEAPVGLGARWSVTESKVELGIRFELTTEYELLAWRRGGAIVRGTYSLALTQSQSRAEDPEFPARLQKVDLKGSSELSTGAFSTGNKRGRWTEHDASGMPTARLLIDPSCRIIDQAVYGAPAEAAGIVPGDLVLAAGKRSLESAESIRLSLQAAGTRPLIDRRGRPVNAAAACIGGRSAQSSKSSFGQ